MLHELNGHWCVSAHSCTHMTSACCLRRMFREVRHACMYFLVGNYRWYCSSVKLLDCRQCLLCTVVSLGLQVLAGRGVVGGRCHGSMQQAFSDSWDCAYCGDSNIYQVIIVRSRPALLGLPHKNTDVLINGSAVSPLCSLERHHQLSPPVAVLTRTHV
jgi:hypothetical protein